MANVPGAHAAHDTERDTGATKPLSHEVQASISCGA